MNMNTASQGTNKYLNTSIHFQGRDELLVLGRVGF